ncbi:potassium channel subfamily K member 1-like [Scleropages formosus]|uniref:Potassium channel subfamily K member n=1 Tax=Scleropages formosus TaxID=113540 RepID=A0A0P7WSV7_SCLFO|nr:potassium channel subfamily K member 1-like [Scleropages formosus]
MARCVSTGSWRRFALLLVGYMLYLLVGAALFSAVEQPYEELLRQELRGLRLELLRDSACVSEERLDAFLSRVLEASDQGVSVLDAESARDPWNWDFTSALFFASTVLTTTDKTITLALDLWTRTLITLFAFQLFPRRRVMLSLVLPGYGHTVPLSDGGKAFSIIYSLIGIPFTLLFLTAVVQRIMVFTTRRPVAYVHRRWGIPRSKVAAIHAVLLALLAISFFFLIPAIIFSVLEEDWNFLESFYFCFISLSTIGLGDYVPGEGYHQKYRELYKLSITVYLIVGLIAMLVVLETFCELKQMKQLRKMFYLEKEMPEDQLVIINQDQLSFYSVTDPIAVVQEDKVDMFAGALGHLGNGLPTH